MNRDVAADPKKVWPFPEVWDSTMRSAYLSCPRKFYWEFLRGYSMSERSIHLHFGAAYARGLEEWRIGVWEHGLSARDALWPAVRALVIEWGDGEDVPEDDYKNLTSCLLLLEAHTRAYAPATDIVQPYLDSEGKAAIEYTFAIPIPEVLHPTTGQPIIYAGRFDMMGVYNHSDIVVVDDKTTRQMGPSWSKQWLMRGQLIGYCWAAQQYGLPVLMACVRGAKITKKELSFADAFPQYNQQMVDNWYKQLVFDLKQAIQSWETQYWAMDFADACGAYGGCSFSLLCTAVDPVKWLESHYKRRHWNPLAADPTAPEKTDG